MSPEREPLMTVAQIADMLTVSRQTVRRLFERHELRGVKVGAQWRARAEDVERLATPVDVTPPVAMRHEMSHPSAPSSFGDGPTMRIFAERPWESDDTGAASSAAGRARSAEKRKTAAQRY